MGTYCNFLAQLTVDASISFPIMAGGTIVLTTIGGLVFFKEKVTLKMLIGVVFAVFSIVLFAI